MDRSGGRDNQGPASQRTATRSARGSLGRQTVDNGGQEEGGDAIRKVSNLPILLSVFGLALRLHNARGRMLFSSGHRVIGGQCSGGPQDTRVALLSCMSNLSTKQQTPLSKVGKSCPLRGFQPPERGAADGQCFNGLRTYFRRPWSMPTSPPVHKAHGSGF